MSDPNSRFFALDIPEEERLRAFMEEASLTDADLDELEHRVIEGASWMDAGQLAALALTLGRAGRTKSALALEEVEAALERRQHPDEAMVVRMAVELLAPRPKASVERADSGYAYRNVARGLSLYVEDPVAAFWHGKGRWGPPIRPDLDRPPRYFRNPEDLDAMYEFATDGGTVIVGFRPRLWEGPMRPLRLTACGAARDPGFRSLIRWSQVSSIGQVGARAALEVNGEPLEVLPPRPAMGTELLIDLMARLLKRARS